MKYVYMASIAAFTGVVLLFKFQNLETATVSLFSTSVSLPLSLLVLLLYVLGMSSDGFVLTLLRSWMLGAKGRPG